MCAAMFGQPRSAAFATRVSFSCEQLVLELFYVEWAVIPPQTSIIVASIKRNDIEKRKFLLQNGTDCFLFLLARRQWRGFTLKVCTILKGLNRQLIVLRMDLRINVFEELTGKSIYQFESQTFCCCHVVGLLKIIISPFMLKKTLQTTLSTLELSLIVQMSQDGIETCFLSEELHSRRQFSPTSRPLLSKVHWVVRTKGSRMSITDDLYRLVKLTCPFVRVVRIV